MYAFFKTWCEIQADYGNTGFAENMTYHRFKYSWYSFLQLTDIQMQDGFTCPVCETSPTIIICDGTSLSFRRQLLVSVPEQVDENAPVFKGR